MSFHLGQLKLALEGVLRLARMVKLAQEHEFSAMEIHGIWDINKLLENMLRIQQFSTYFQAISYRFLLDMLSWDLRRSKRRLSKAPKPGGMTCQPCTQTCRYCSNFGIWSESWRNRNGTWTTRRWKTHLFLSDLFHRLAYRKGLEPPLQDPFVKGLSKDCNHCQLLHLGSDTFLNLWIPLLLETQACYR